MKFTTYIFLSFAGAIAVTFYAIYSREQFYPIMLFLVSSKLAFLVNANMLIASALLVGQFLKSIFFGYLRDAEVELLYDKAKFAITETCLALTIFRSELTAPIFALFGCLIFLKGFHWLCNARLDYLEQVMPVSALTLTRLFMLILTLIACDIGATYACVQYTMQHGRSVLILFGFEFGLLCISSFYLSTRFALQVLDGYLTNGLSTKGLYTMIFDLICSALRFVTYVFFFGLVFVYYGLPIHIIREVYVAFHVFQKRLVSFIRYLQLSRNLDGRFEDATTEDIAAAGDCLICREGMERGKKLPCSHVFHMDCLRMWLQHQQSCPLCRADIPTAEPGRGRGDAARAREAEANDEVRRAREPAAAANAPPDAAVVREDGQQQHQQVPGRGGEGVAEGQPVQPAPAAQTSSIEPQRHEEEDIRESVAFFPIKRAIQFFLEPIPAEESLADILPCFFIVSNHLVSPFNFGEDQAAKLLDINWAAPVHFYPDRKSSVFRYLVKGTVILATGVTKDLEGNEWLDVPDGWVRRRAPSCEIPLPLAESNSTTNVAYSTAADAECEGDRASSLPAGYSNVVTHLTTFYPGTRRFNSFVEFLEETEERAEAKVTALLPQAASEASLASVAADAIREPSKMSAHRASRRQHLQLVSEALYRMKKKHVEKRRGGGALRIPRIDRVSRSGALAPPFSAMVDAVSSSSMSPTSGLKQPEEENMTDEDGQKRFAITARKAVHKFQQEISELKEVAAIARKSPTHRSRMIGRTVLALRRRLETLSGQLDAAQESIVFCRETLHRFELDVFASAVMKEDIATVEADEEECDDEYADEDDDEYSDQDLSGAHMNVSPILDPSNRTREVDEIARLNVEASDEIGDNSLATCDGITSV